LATGFKIPKLHISPHRPQSSVMNFSRFSEQTAIISVHNMDC